MNDVDALLFQNRYRIPSARMRGRDYGVDGAYFVTICTKHREHFFGEIRNGVMGLSDVGCAAWWCWDAIPDHFPFVIPDVFVVMPNHVHGVIRISHDVCDAVETQNFASLRDHEWRPNRFGPQSMNVGSIVRAFKIGVMKYARERDIEFAWQPRFHDRIIRNHRAYRHIRSYIINNPRMWHRDRNNQ